MLFLSCETRVLDDESDNQNKRKDVFIEAKNWLCKKTRLPFEINDPRFHSAARPQNLDRRMSPERTRETSAVSFGDFLTADYDRRLRPREKSPRSERQFRTAVGNRRS